MSIASAWADKGTALSRVLWWLSQLVNAQDGEGRAVVKLAKCQWRGRNASTRTENEENSLRSDR